MKSSKKWIALCLAVLMAISVFAGCDNSQNTSSGSTADSTASKSSEPAASEDSGSEAQQTGTDTDPFGKYDETITISAVKDLGQTGLEVPPEDSLEDNVWTRYFKDTLNIELDWLWSTNTQQYEQKVNIAITSDDIPDIMRVTGTQLKMMYENDQLMDMTEVYETYAADFTKEVMSSDGGSGMLSATFDGKLYAVPFVGSGLGNARVLWIRTDWLEKLNLEVPTTVDEFMAVAEAFTTQDPDGNSVDDTYGLGVYKDLFGMGYTFNSGYADLEGFFNMYNAYPNIWVEKDGALAYGSIQPEVKDGLTALQDMFAKGYIDPEFGVKDANKVKEDASSDKIGMEFGGFWNAAWHNDAKVANPDIEWTPVAIPATADGSNAKAQLPFGTTQYYAVSSKCENPEAVIRLLNAQLEKGYGETAEPTVYNITPEGYGTYQCPPVYVEPPMKNFDAAVNVSAAIESGDTSALNEEELNYYDMSMLSIEKGDHSNNNWHQLKMFGPNGSLTVMKKYWDDGDVVENAFYGAPTDTMTEKMSTLEKQELTSFTGIILGADIGEFDTFIDNWNTLGGEQITEEVNAWYQEQ